MAQLRSRSQLRDGHPHGSANSALPTSSGTSIEQSQSAPAATADDISRSAPSRSWYQTAKEPEMRSPRPNAVDLPQTTLASAAKNESLPAPNVQSLPPRAAPYGENTKDTRLPIISSAVHTPSGSVGVDRPGNSFNTATLKVSTLSSTAKHASHGAQLDELQSLRLAAPAPVTTDVYHRGTVQELDSTRLRSQAGAHGPPAAVEGRRVEIYPSQAPASVQQPTQHEPSRLPVVEDAVERSVTANRPEQGKYSYTPVPAPTPASDVNLSLLSPLQQAIRAPPTPKLAFPFV